MRELSPSTKAWIGIGASVAAYDILCPKGETLSEGVDRALERGKFTRVAALGGIAIVAAHLANVLPEKYDPFHYALGWKDRPESIIEELSTD